MIALGGERSSSRRWVEQELAELEGPGGLRAGFSAVTFKLRWQDETRKKLPGLHTDYGALPLPLGGGGGGVLAKPGMAGLRETQVRACGKGVT